jgi:hypothetical protein
MSDQISDADDSHSFVRRNKGGVAEMTLIILPRLLDACGFSRGLRWRPA